MIRAFLILITKDSFYLNTDDIECMEPWSKWHIDYLIVNCTRIKLKNNHEYFTILPCVDALKIWK